MGRMSREKGARGEREAAEELRRLLGLADGEAHRGRQYHGGPDSPDVVLKDVNIHVEAKRVEALKLYDSLHQAAQDAPRGKVPVVWHRRNKHRSVLILSTSDLVTFAREIVRVVDLKRAAAEHLSK